MRSIRHLLAVVLMAVAASLGLVVATTGPAAACSCVVAGIAQHARWADAIFTGEVAGAPDIDAQVSTYTFAVDRVYAGDVAARAEVRTAAQGSACGLEGLQPGRRYLVFASSGDGGLQASSCGGTRAVEASYVDRLERHLGAGAAPDRAAAEQGRAVDSVPGRTVLLAVAGVSGAVILTGLVVGALRGRRPA